MVIEASKSLMNRSLIVQSQFPSISISGSSTADDVILLQAALEDFKNIKSDLYCGSGGTVLRFLALRVSKTPGTYRLLADSRLLERPQNTLVDILSSLGVGAQINAQGIHINSTGWQLPKTISIDLSHSSQFLSALLLCAWDLESDLEIHCLNLNSASDYLSMTLNFLKNLGMRIITTEKGLIILKQQKPLLNTVEVEPDLSNVFAMAAWGALHSPITLPWPENSLQPDKAFLDFFKTMGVPYEIKNKQLTIYPVKEFFPLNASLQSCPDLFPVLCVLCSQAKGFSKLYGAPQLKLKESNRIQKISALLNQLHIENTPTDDGIYITGSPESLKNARSNSQKPPINENLPFDPDHDHRIAMAAGLFKTLGYPITILNPEVVQKSFPNFWRAIQCSPS